MKGHRHEVAEHSFDKTGPKSTRSSAASQRAAGAETYALPLSPCEDLHDLIATRASELCRERGYRNRFALDAWLDAERKILSQIPPV